jgi:hypothetical protein
VAVTVAAGKPNPAAAPTRREEQETKPISLATLSALAFGLGIATGLG